MQRPLLSRAGATSTLGCGRTAHDSLRCSKASRLTFRRQGPRSITPQTAPRTAVRDRNGGRGLPFRSRREADARPGGSEQSRLHVETELHFIVVPSRSAQLGFLGVATRVGLAGTIAGRQLRRTEEFPRMRIRLWRSG
jgi:hypothetical protein